MLCKVVVLCDLVDVVLCLFVVLLVVKKCDEVLVFEM